MGIVFPKGQLLRIRDAFGKLAVGTRLQRIRDKRLRIARASALRHDEEDLSVSPGGGASTVARHPKTLEISIETSARFSEPVSPRDGRAREKKSAGRTATGGRGTAENNCGAHASIYIHINFDLFKFKFKYEYNVSFFYNQRYIYITYANYLLKLYLNVLITF